MSSRSSSSLQESGTWRGFLIGLVPLGLLVAIIIIVLFLTALTRQLFTASRFFAQQQATLLMVILALILALVVYGVAAWLTLGRVELWQQEGAERQASATLWTLGITALIVVLPVVLALVLPQHPAP